ncbi:MAG: recombination protein RecR [Tissierellia bacterium]|nr:recombination protein RecR [Tissierellia bacterium]
MRKSNSPINNLANQLSKLPGIGKKTAQRLTYHIIEMDEKDVRELSESIMEAKENTRFCSQCYNLTDTDPCEICSNANRDQSIICVVDNPKEVIAMEKAGRYNGLYHVLHGTVSSDNPNLRIKEMLERLEGDEVKEVILAMSPSVEGETTALYISQYLKREGVKVTRIAYGLPYGGEMDYFDDDTINMAIENRIEF